MRLLKFNNEIVDIDEKTAIGIDLQAYDVAEPGSRKVAASNKFTIPLTANNLRIIGFAGNPQSISTTVYSSLVCNYWNQNKQLIRSGTARITEVGERISVFAFEKSAVWTLMQDFTWGDFQEEFITWLQEEKGLPSAAAPFVGTFANFLAPYIAATEGVVLPFIIGTLGLYDPDDGENFVEDLGSLYLKYDRTYLGANINGHGGHFCAYCKSIFEFIEDKYEVDFSTAGAEAYNIFSDVVAEAMYTPIRNLSIQHTLTGFYFLFDDQSKFLPEDTTVDKVDKTLYDFTKAFFQYFNCLIDRVNTLDGTEKYLIRRFDDITNAPVIDLSGKFTGIATFLPVIENYNQNNWIKFSGIYEGGDPLTNSKKIVCNNRNLDVGASDEGLIDIDVYIPDGFVAGGDIVLDLSAPETLSSFSFFVSLGNASTYVKSMQEDVEVSTPVILKIARVYALTDEYNTLASMAAYPVFYKVKRWLTLNEVDSLVYFARYYIKELNGYFFLNKIEGYNPEKSTEATKIELIKIPS